MKTLTLTLALAILAAAAPAEAQSRAARVALGVASMALGGYALAYDPPDVTAAVRGSGTGPYSWEETHENFRCGPDAVAGWAVIRVDWENRYGRHSYCKLVSAFPVLWRGDGYFLLVPFERRDSPGTYRIPDNTTYSGSGTVTVRTSTLHTAIVNRSIAQMAAGAGLIVAGAALALWPDPPVEVDVDPGAGRIRVSRAFGF